MRNVNDVRTLLKAGADKVGINTAAIENPEFVKEAADIFGSQCIVVAVDVKRENNEHPRWTVYTHGGRHRTSGCPRVGQTYGAKWGGRVIVD